MAQAKSKQVVKPATVAANTTATVAANTTATVAANTTAPLPNGLTALVQQAQNYNLQASGVRLVRAPVQYINGWPNGQPVPGAQPLVIAGVPFTGTMAASNPLANPAKLAVPFTMANGNTVVKLVAPCPTTSKNASNAACGNAVNMALAGGKTATLAQLGQLCIAAQGGNAANVAAWLGYARKRWLKPV